MLAKFKKNIVHAWKYIGIKKLRNIRRYISNKRFRRAKNVTICMQFAKKTLKTKINDRIFSIEFVPYL
jgi:hypothetical protein